MARTIALSLLLRLLITGVVVVVMVVSAQDADNNNSNNNVVSESCDQQTRLLNNNTALEETAPSLQCSINFDVSNTCTVDYAPVSTNYSNACNEAGGQFYTKDLLLDCTVDLGGQTYQGKSYYLNTPSCIGISCTGSEIERELEMNLYPKLEDYYAARGVQCEISLATRTMRPATVLWTMVTTTTILIYSVSLRQ